jgi:hypothetical protein
LLQIKPIDYETKQREKKIKTKGKKAAVVFTNDDNPTASIRIIDFNFYLFWFLLAAADVYILSLFIVLFYYNE